MALLMGQNRLFLPLRSVKAREFEELWREKVYTRLAGFFQCKLARTSSFWPVKTDKWRATKITYTQVYIIPICFIYSLKKYEKLKQKESQLVESYSCYRYLKLCSAKSIRRSIDM